MQQTANDVEQEVLPESMGELYELSIKLWDAAVLSKTKAARQQYNRVADKVNKIKGNKILKRL